MSEKLYTYWIFYLKRQYQTSQYIPNKMFTDIYAYTSNKEYAERFKKDRDMSKFIIKKVKLQKDQLNCMVFEEPMAYLKEIKGLTKDKDFNLVPFRLVVTEEENNHIRNICNAAILSKIFIHAWDNPFVYKNKYIKALKSVGYITIYNSICAEGTEVSDETPNIEPDLLSCFLKEYQSLIIKREDIE